MRVVGGEFRGRRLTAPRGRAVRPTADRVREALFQVLGPLDGIVALDLFAGSGALGIEALSRGAARVVFVDRSAAAAACVEGNLPPEARTRAEVVRADALGFLARRDAGPFGLAFLDPPYSSASRLGGPLSAALPRVLTEDALIVTESDKRAPLTLDLPVAWERPYGDTLVVVHRAG